MKLILAAGAALVALSTTLAYAGEMADTCRARLEADGRDTSGCDCLEQKISENPALEAEFRELGEIEDKDARFDAASDDAKAAMTACTR